MVGPYNGFGCGISFEIQGIVKTTLYYLHESCELFKGINVQFLEIIVEYCQSHKTLLWI